MVSWGGPDDGGPPAGPIRIARMTTHAFTARDRQYPPDDSAWRDPNHHPEDVVEVEIRAELAAVCPRYEWNWWHEQLRPRTRISGGVGSSEGKLEIAIRTRPEDVETVARELLAAVAEVSAGYPENFEQWRLEQEKQRRDRLRREEEMNAPYQAVVNGVMEEYGSG